MHNYWRNRIPTRKELLTEICYGLLNGWILEKLLFKDALFVSDVAPFPCRPMFWPLQIVPDAGSILTAAGSGFVEIVAEPVRSAAIEVQFASNNDVNV